MGKTEIIAEPGTLQIIILREFDAPRGQVFRAFTEPDLLVQWLGPSRLRMTIDRYELRDGGVWRFTHSGEDGTQHHFHGVFHGAPSVEGIVRTSEYEGYPGPVSLETATFEEQDGKTLVRQNAVFQSVENRDGMIESGMEEGVNDSMDRLDALLAASR